VACLAGLSSSAVAELQPLVLDPARSGRAGITERDQNMPDRFDQLIVMNTGLPVGEPISDGFAMWNSYAASDPDIPVAGLLAMSSPGALNPFGGA
jgi:hypothetical protein